MSTWAAGLAQASATDVTTLSVAGATIMIVSVGLVLALTVFCLVRILRGPAPSARHHAPLNIDMRDPD
jgi:hypothetical protein